MTIHTKKRPLDKSLQGYEITKEGDYAILTVSDNGRGIAAADLGKIFEPFYTNKVTGQSGTGLGLAVVWGNVKDYEGFVNVQSESGPADPGHDHGARHGRPGDLSARPGD